MDAPPPYEEVAGPSAASNTNRPPAVQRSSNNHLKVRNGIPPHVRRSMEDEGRDLPKGWVRSYDPENDHQFYVDTTADPPRSIWQHPYDDATYLNTLDPKERQRIEGMHRVPSTADMMAESSDEDGDHHQHHHQQQQAHHGGTSTNPAAASTSSGEPKGATRLGRKLKDKITQSTHEEREAQRQERARQEAEYYERHRQLRQAMVQAARTGEPQLVGKDPRTGQDLYVEPPDGGVPGGAYGYNPYTRGPYSNPNARFLRPGGAYARPGGGGYGGGYGLPLAGGLLGGLLIGDAIGGFGGGFGGGGL